MGFGKVVRSSVTSQDLFRLRSLGSNLDGPKPFQMIGYYFLTAKRLLFILYFMWHNGGLKAAEKKIDDSHFVSHFIVAHLNWPQ